MEHKPKSGRGWRVLLTEIGIIVLGVGIALGAQQAVDWLQWRSQVAEAKETIATELSRNMANAITRMRNQDCTDRRLDALALILDAAAKSGNLPAVGQIRNPPRAIWPSGAWESVVASQTATHFPRPLLVSMAEAYKFMQRIELYSSQEMDAWNALYPIAGPGRRLDPASEADLRKAISTARTHNHFMASLSMQMVNTVRRMHLTFGPDDRGRIDEALNRPPAPICGPIGPVTPSYGLGAPRAASTILDDTMKSLRDLTKDGQ